MANELTYKQALVIALIPAIISAASAYFAQRAESSAGNLELIQSIKQARLTERDLIQHEATKINQLAYLIPVADNRAWSNYLKCRQADVSRFDCAKKQKQVIPTVTPKIIAEVLQGGY